jgi:hypothetical protein
MPDADQRPDNPDTRLARGGETDTTRFGMEEGDNTDVPATGVDPDRQSPDKQ